jgi:hypothetical protein
MAAYVVYDPYWDPVWGYETEEEAEAACKPGGAHPGCHVIFEPKARPGDCSGIPVTQKPWEKN